MSNKVNDTEIFSKQESLAHVSVLENDLGGERMSGETSDYDPRHALKHFPTRVLGRSALALFLYVLQRERICMGAP